MLRTIQGVSVPEVPEGRKAVELYFLLRKSEGSLTGWVFWVGERVAQGKGVESKLSKFAIFCSVLHVKQPGCNEYELLWPGKACQDWLETNMWEQHGSGVLKPCACWSSGP